MFLNRVHLDPRCREARRDLSDPYQLHSTLCRAFSGSERKCPKGEFLWRLEPETDPTGYPRILVQSRTIPDWMGVNVQGWLAKADPAIDLKERLKLDSLKAGQRFRFRLRANPCVTRNGKRLGLLRLKEQETWIERKAERHGFSLPRLASFDLSESSQERVDVRISQEQILQGNQHSGNAIRIFFGAVRRNSHGYRTGQFQGFAADRRRTWQSPGAWALVGGADNLRKFRYRPPAWVRNDHGKNRKHSGPIVAGKNQFRF